MTANSPQLPQPVQTRNTLQWIAIALGVAVLIVACISLGRWQWHRHTDRDAVIATIEHNYNTPAVPLTDVVPTTDTPLPHEDVWTSVTVTGHYVTEGTALLRNRPINSTPSVHMLVPFETTEGNVILVNRGWVPYQGNAERPPLPAVPPGEVTITVHLRLDEQPSTRNAPPGQVQAINIDQALTAGATYGGLDPHWADGRTYLVYGSLAAESPAPPEPILALPKPDIDPRSHLSYAFQWWVFAVGALGGFFVLLARERKVRRTAREGIVVNPFLTLNERAEVQDLGPDVTAQARPSKAAKRAHSHSEEDYEDSLFE